ncbi:hypothetical protein PV336_37010 [Streptomyces sp. MI02-2A]|uniref:hypothetical protein n=1 Tax=unclassified Streptomyces TaxID=2593676 RepID=UPI000E2855BF|nr:MULTISPECIES: hypothetical protein [unclassified Streptomyces]MDX3264731.1 hypothetical protein [Streptomyces sp. MI02-2A]
MPNSPRCRGTSAEGSGLHWRPKRPDLFIAARIDADQAHEQLLAAQTEPVDQVRAFAPRGTSSVSRVRADSGPLEPHRR